MNWLIISSSLASQQCLLTLLANEVMGLVFLFVLKVLELDLAIPFPPQELSLSGSVIYSGKATVSHTKTSLVFARYISGHPSRFADPF